MAEVSQNVHWTVEYLDLEHPLDDTGVLLHSEHSPSPFPRYGHALTSTSTLGGDLFLFGGMSIPKNRRNDKHNHYHNRGHGRSGSHRKHQIMSTSITENDLYMLSASNGTPDISVRLVHTTGSRPPPRIGYSCTLTDDGEGLVVWGGRPGNSAAHEAVEGGRTVAYAESLPCEQHSHSSKHTCDSVYILDFGMSDNLVLSRQNC